MKTDSILSKAEARVSRGYVEGLKINRDTVRDYLKRGILRRHPESTSGRVLIFGDEVVTHTKKDLRRIKRCKKWGINPDTI